MRNVKIHLKKIGLNEKYTPQNSAKVGRIRLVEKVKPENSAEWKKIRLVEKVTPENLAWMKKTAYMYATWPFWKCQSDSYGIFISVLVTQMTFLEVSE